ncbi:MAG: ABC transporter ATP-binding protein [Xenophilus sp.]
MTASGQGVIRLRGVGKRFGSGPAGAGGHTDALRDVSLSIAPGEFVCLLGPSGCGKSTILNLIAGFESPTQGTLDIGGAPVPSPGPGRGMVFQKPILFPWLSVLDNVTFGPRMAGVPPEVYLPSAEDYLRRVGLQGFERHATWQLSGGMQQRVALARAWILNPGILLMDEPFGALDAQTRMMMQELLNGIWASIRTTILFVTHDVDEALFIADRVLVMSARPGRIVEDLAVPIARPRDIEAMAASPQVGELRRHILHRVREEARSSIP